ncbi:MAG: phosphoglucosamine mutase [Calditrichaeota bacterium]|nr:MAG: phosphoglucosamine mutase [Calditrichota bacterium]
MSRLMVSVSGVRGEVGSTLTPQVIEKYTLAFGSFLNGGSVVLGRDSRVSGPFVSQIVKGCLLATGCKVIDIGIVPTPTVQMAIEHHHAEGGIAITASHNPVQWNGLKFMDGNGRFLSPEKAARVYAMGDAGEWHLQDWQNLGSEEADTEANQRHIDAILNLDYVDADLIRSKKFKVVCDTVNGAGGLIIPRLLEALGCSVTVINGDAHGRFAHTPEPLPENITELCEAVKQEGADAGFAVDPDVDRCAIVDNTGAPLGEEYTLALAVKLVLSKKMGRVVVNMSTSRASEDIARYYNCTFSRSKVGEINVAEKMLEMEAIIGGEGNGGVILPELHLGRDAPLAVALTLQQMAESGKTLRELFLELPQYHMVKAKVSIEGMDPDAVLQRMADKYKEANINLLDGVKIDFENSWVHLRKSNTEPIVRVMTEAPEMEEARALADRFMQEIQSAG